MHGLVLAQPINKWRPSPIAESGTGHGLGWRRCSILVPLTLVVALQTIFCTARQALAQLLAQRLLIVARLTTARPDRSPSVQLLTGLRKLHHLGCVKSARCRTDGPGA